MTAIAAILTDGRPARAQLDAMMAAMAGRVHDGSDVRVSGHIGLGAAMLHTTSESFEAPQPFANEDHSISVVLDGYLTNWEELRDDLVARGVRLRNRSDAELVLRAYEQWGEGCAARIEGEFAMVVADQRRNFIYAARDHRGLRPLHIYRDRHALLIASDIGAIIAAAEAKPKVNLDFLANLAANAWFLRDATAWEGVERLAPAHWMSFDGTTRKTCRYYDLPLAVTVRYRREEEYVEHYREVLFDAVRRASRSHRPIAMTVSGGLDSSAVFAVAHELERQGRLLAPGLQAYTLAGEPGSPADEVAYARAAAQHLGRPLVEVPLFRPDADWFREQARQNRDIPIPQNGAMSLDLEKRAYGDGCRIYMGGGGGDEWLDGTSAYYRQLARDFDLPRYLAAFARDREQFGLRRTIRRALPPTLGALLSPAARVRMYQNRARRRFANPDHLFWMKPAWRERLLEQELAYEASVPMEPDGMRRWGALYSPYALLASSMMNVQYGSVGVDARDPMMSRGFIGFCATTPDWTRNQGGLNKVVHRKAMAGLLTDIIVNRRSKADFNATGVAAEFARFTDAQTDSLVYELCDREAVKRITRAETGFDVAIDRGWEVWGLFAIAVFQLNNEARRG